MSAYPPAIFAIGRNYAEHAAEMGGTSPELPVIFMKNPASVIGNGEPIVLSPICAEPHEQVDFEGELAVVIGAAARDVEERDTDRFIEGYAIANDVSAVGGSATAQAGSSYAARASTPSVRSAKPSSVRRCRIPSSCS